MELGLLLRLGDVMNVILCYLLHSIFKGDNPTWVIFVETDFQVGLYSDFYSLVSFKLYMMIETTKLYILMSVWMPLTFIQGYNCMRNKKKMSIFLKMLLSI